MTRLTHPPGTLLSFPTEPIFAFSPAPTGRWGTILVLRHERVPGIGPASVVAILDCVTTTRPRAAEMQDVGIMNAAPLYGTEDRWALMFLLLLEDEDRSRWPSFEVIGARPLPKEEAGTPWRFMVPATSLSLHAEGRWRYDHDREALFRERERMDRERAAREAEMERRQRERLRGLTIEMLLDETLLIAWEERSADIPPAFLATLRMRAREMLFAIAALGPRPRRPAVRAEMRAFVEWVNAAVAAPDADLIATMEREELHAFLQEVAWASNQRPLVDEIEGWRDW
ncbi:MAG: hypothetical protein AAF371_19870 [Pseudomonadota bacterium]